ncbi:MAG: DUF4242 domain-containing protein [Williamsia sp.]|nr:DUF4242 domain-containing protein [Williamsia sp.]
MKKFMIERKLPGAGSMSAEELKAIRETSLRVIEELDQPYKWIQSFITDDAIYCIHEAETEKQVREHAARCHFPINRVEEIRMVIGPHPSIEGT